MAVTENAGKKGRPKVTDREIKSKSYTLKIVYADSDNLKRAKGRASPTLLTPFWTNT